MSNCNNCDDTGKYKKPIDEEAFGRVFDKYFDTGFMCGDDAYKKAIQRVGYTIVPCYC